MFKKFTDDIYKSMNKQHNIFVLVGNGFDMAILNKYKTGRNKGKTSSYNDFFEYVRYYGLSNSDNILFNQMKENLENGKENWSDFELIIRNLYEQNVYNIDVIEKCVDEFQLYFTCFLNDLVDSDLLLSINNDFREKKLALQSLSKFLYDLDKNCGIGFSKNTAHYDLYNFVFANFNYTSLLDNYIYLDKQQFNPHGYKTVDTNFGFYPDLNGEIYYAPTRYTAYLYTDIIHPHGFQAVPRSILFGMDKVSYDRASSPEKRLIKSYWAQYEINYKAYFDDAELFIIYGMSLAETDGWWLDNIFDAINRKDKKCELIIYWYGNVSEEFVKDQFLTSCIRHKEATQEDIDYVKNNIFVVTFEKNDTYFLGLEKK